MVEGDVGLDQRPGRGKKIIWRAKEELGEFKGNLSLRLRAAFIPLLEFDIEPGSKFKRGKVYDISWRFGSEITPIKIELYRGSSKVLDLIPQTEENTYNWEVPKALDLADGYYLRATADGREAKSKPFTISRKVPLAAFIIPGAILVGGVTYLIISAGSDTGSEIPDPILPN